MTWYAAVKWRVGAPVAERVRRLDEDLPICLAMLADEGASIDDLVRILENCLDEMEERR